MGCGEQWANCTLEQTWLNLDRRLVSGGQKYRRFKDIVASEGEENANSLRARKKEQQSLHGDLHPGVPHWYAHPDWPTSPVPWILFFPLSPTI